MSDTPVSRHLRPAEEFTQAMKDRLAMRLLKRPDRADRGEVLPRTQAALALPSDTPEQAAERVQALVEALAEERLVVPVAVEASPDDPDHQPLDSSKSPLEMIDTPDGASVVAFSSSDALLRWDPSGRPMTSRSYKVAAGAALENGAGTITLDPGSPGRTVIPRAAVMALASGDQWLPAWQDKELRQQLKDIAQGVCPSVIAVNLRPMPGYGQAAWDGGVAVDLLIDPVRAVKEGIDQQKLMAQLALAVKKVGACERLREASQRVELVPRPVESV